MANGEVGYGRLTELISGGQSVMIEPQVGKVKTDHTIDEFTVIIPKSLKLFI